MNWKVGDIAICITPGSKMEGLEVEIVSALQGPDKAYEADGSKGSVGSHHEVDPGMPTVMHGNVWCAQPNELIPLPPANEVTTWEECIFKPRELVTEK